MSEAITRGDLAALQDWLRINGIGERVSDCHPLGGGTQNLVMRMQVDGRTVVWRRPPAHPRPSSNATMLREIAALRSLSGSSVPHPTLIAACDDLDVLGVVFYLMSDVDGFNPGQEAPTPYVGEATLRHQAGLAVARSLAALSTVDWHASPLAEFHRPGSFLQRQVPQWRKAYEGYLQHGAYRRDSLSGVDKLGDWLDANRPPDRPPGVMHGDFHLNNVLLRRDRAEVAGIVDWEMCTVGDPLLDLAWLIVCWPHHPAPVRTGDVLAAHGDMATRRELIEAYTRAGGSTTAALDWYLALAAYKLGIVLEGTWVRALAGQAPRPIGERLHRDAVRLISLGTEIAAGARPFE